MNPLRLAYITETSAHDKHAWSGTAHYVYEALAERGFRVTALGPAIPSAMRLILGALNKLSLSVTGKRFDYRHSTLYARAFGRIFSQKIRQGEFDAIVVCGGTEYGAYLETPLPVYYVLDRTIGGAIGYHSILSNLWQFSMKQSIATDKRAMQNASHLFFSSEWAARHAETLYGIEQNKIHVVPFGANMDRLPSREEALKPRHDKTCRLLFVGTSWKNKGADIAVACLKSLNTGGMQASLTIVGCTPPEPVNDPAIHIIPFIDKNTDQGIHELSALFSTHHFFILPTRFDCTPIVFCESSAFGVPVLSADTGGVRGHVKEGTNGFLIPFDDKGEGYAQRIRSVFSQAEAYETLRRTTRLFFEEKLNWRSWAGAFAKAIGAGEAPR